MARYHINGRGEPGPCRAQKGRCPYGNESEHYQTQAEALAAYESKQQTSFPAKHSNQYSFPEWNAPKSLEDSWNYVSNVGTELTSHNTYSRAEASKWSHLWAQSWDKMQGDSGRELTPQQVQNRFYQALDHRWSHGIHLLASINRPLTPGAIKTPTVSVEQMAMTIKSDANCSVVISDVHGDVKVLRKTLERLRIIDSQGKKISSAKVIQLGDLVDGRSDTDEETLHSSESWIDVSLLGNHEAAILGFNHFRGQPQHISCALKLREMANEGRIKLAHLQNDTLITHAGVSASTRYPDPETATEFLNKTWSDCLNRPGFRPDEIFAVDKFRGGATHFGGAIWQDWKSLIASDPGWPQIVGHTPLGEVESNRGMTCQAIDQGSARLGIALLSSSGAASYSSSLQGTD